MNNQHSARVAMAQKPRFGWCRAVLLAAVVGSLLWAAESGVTAQRSNPAEQTRPVVRVLTSADCTTEKLGRDIAAAAIGEPVRSVTLSPPSWVESSGAAPAHCRINGSMAPVDTVASAKPINFSVVLPASWNGR